jgi:cell wall-associated NlpC family hydrolase
MKHLILLLLIFVFILSACKSSARFSTVSSVNKEKSRGEQEYSENASDLNNFIEQWLHTPYKYGGMSKSGVDCSGFASIVMRDVYGIKVPRTAQDQYSSGENVRTGWKSPGDLVFFKNVRGRGIDHVGIYLGNSRFVHASTNKGVIISDLDEDYYRKRYVGTRRYVK